MIHEDSLKEIKEDVFNEIVERLPENIKPFDESQIGESGFGNKIGCGDGRVLKETNGKPAPEVRVFGGGLGILANVLAFLDKEDLSSKKNYEVAKSAVEKVLGGVITFHTDTHSHEGGLRCEGCGHAKNFLGKLHNEYGLSDQSSEFLKEVLGVLPEESKSNYNDEHAEEAIVIINGNFILSDLENIGHQIFVHNKGIQSEILRRVVREMKKNMPRVMHKHKSIQGVENSLIQVAQDQTEKTVELLPKARDLSKEGKVILVKTGDDGKPVIEILRPR